MPDSDDDLTLPPVQDGEPTWAADLRAKFDKRGDQLRESRSELGALKRENAVLASGVTLDEKQRKAVLAAIDGDITADSIRDTAKHFGWFTPPETPEQQQEQQTQQSAQTQQRIAQDMAGGQAATSGVIKPEDVNDWTADRWGAFKKAHPAAAEALMRGNEVTGLSLT